MIRLEDGFRRVQPADTYGLAYDNMGRMIGTTTQHAFLPGVTFSNAYAYDAASNRTSFTGPCSTAAPGCASDSYGYDTLNRPTSITDSMAGQFTFSYDALSRRTALNRPNGMNTTYSYDSLSRLLNVLHKAGTTEVYYRGERIPFTQLKEPLRKPASPPPPMVRAIVIRRAKPDHPWRQSYQNMKPRELRPGSTAPTR